MSETLIPTFSLRYVMKAVSAPEIGENIMRNVKTLQQRFDRPQGGHVWRDVELHSGEQNDDKP